MAIIPPPPRARITENGDALRVVIPARRNWLVLIFMGFWLMVWYLGGVTVLLILTLKIGSGASLLFLLLCESALIISGAWVLFYWLWNAIGREEITVGNHSFSVRYAVGSWGKTWEFDCAAVKYLCVMTGGPVTFTWETWLQVGNTGIWRGPLAFDYGVKTYRFGAGMTETEARELLPHLLRRLSPDDPPAASSFSPTGNH